MKKIIFFFLLTTIQFTYSQEEKNEIKTTKTDNSQAVFPEGSFNRFFAKNFRISEDSNYSGRIFFTFIVESDGTLTFFKINSENTEPWIEEEIKRVLKLSPLWKPSFQNNKPIRSQYTCPITLFKE